MKLFLIIPYWINKNTGETRENSKWLFFKIASDSEAAYQWAQSHQHEFFFRVDVVYKPDEINATNESSLKFDFSVKEVSDIFLTDIENYEYRVNIDIVSKIEVKRIETPIKNNESEESIESIENIENNKNI